MVKDSLSTDDSLYISNGKDNPGTIQLGFHEGHYYIQASYLGDADFSKPLKWEKGGKRSKGVWWQYLPEPYFNISEGGFLEQFNNNQELTTVHHRQRRAIERYTSQTSSHFRMERDGGLQ